MNEDKIDGEIIDISQIEELEEYSTEIKLKDWYGESPVRKEK